MGEPAGERIPDEWLWAEYWTRYFTDRQWRHSWVVERRHDGRVVGYLTGTADVRRFDRYVPFLLPGLVGRIVRKRLISRRATRRATIAMLRSILSGGMALPGGIARRYPATLHMNLLPEARRRGLGGRLFALFLDRMRSLAVRGVHAQVLSLNEPIRGFLHKAGFDLVARRPLNAFAHAHPGGVEIHTWVLPL